MDAARDYQEHEQSQGQRMELALAHERSEGQREWREKETWEGCIEEALEQDRLGREREQIDHQARERAHQELERRWLCEEERCEEEDDAQADRDHRGQTQRERRDGCRLG